MFFTRKEPGNVYLFGEGVRDHHVLGMLQVQRSRFDKRTMVVPFSMLDSNFRPMKQFVVTPLAMQQLKLAAKRAGLRMLTVLSPNGRDAYPGVHDAHSLQFDAMVPATTFPVYGKYDHKTVCLSQTTPVLAVDLRVESTVGGRDDETATLLLDATQTQPFKNMAPFALSMENVEALFQLAREYMLVPVALTAVYRVDALPKDLFDLIEVEGRNSGVNVKPYYRPGFSITQAIEDYKNKAMRPVSIVAPEDTHVAVVPLAAPSVLRTRAARAG